MNSLLGQRITWTVTSTGAERSGVVWSAGPVAGTAWVIPDERGEHEGLAVSVRLCKTGHAAEAKDEARSTQHAQTWALAALRTRQPLPDLLAPHIDQNRPGHDPRNRWVARYGYSLIERGAKDVRARGGAS